MFLGATAVFRAAWPCRQWPLTALLLLMVLLLSRFIVLLVSPFILSVSLAVRELLNNY